MAKKLKVIPSPKILVAGIDYELDLPKKHLSFSQIDKYLRCPQQYEYSYVQGIREPVSIHPTEGLVFAHLAETTNRYYLLEGEHITKNEAMTVWHGHSKKLFKLVKNWYAETQKSVTDRAMTFIGKLWNPTPTWEPIEFQGKPGVEWKFEVIIAGVPVIGIIDMIEHRELTDFKVASTSRFYNPDKSLQLELYTLATGIRNVRYIVLEKKSGKITEVCGTKSVKAAQRWLEIVVSKVAYAISMGVFPVCSPAENFLCHKDWCHYFGSCYGGK